MLLHEFDPAADAVLNSQMCVDPIPHFPPVTVACFSHRLFEQALGYPYREGITWTTDALYRETRRNVARRQAEGCLCVDMECAACAAVCRFRGVEFYQFLYTEDNLGGDFWDPGLLGRLPQDAKEAYFRLALELARQVTP